MTNSYFKKVSSSTKRKYDQELDVSKEISTLKNKKTAMLSGFDIKETPKLIDLRKSILPLETRERLVN